MTRIVAKVVCYVVHEGHLLVFTHDDVPLTTAGVQVPAGSVEDGESPADAAMRELREETGLRGEVVRQLGVEDYDLAPVRDEIARRHFFELSVEGADITRRWPAGEDDPETGTGAHSWTCWWLPLAHAHVLAAGLGARLGALTR
ncbi:NUDIX domain-containing protein [Microbacterium esteraromaticum]|uniref:NUDIX domain-containing protein n=1 Tax=Microbacterium esteraromaticum TaxID=57043 RepID=A0A7D8AHU2_9MICO|nr:NUDIX domain-containing protein [Microbacterium esteraromaticum]QMU97902.1 NUDIX domain-containing protein [Microbacterium esteraromaticum]